ncbi:hypothetical protein ACQCVP_23910 [Rossellomorea vietnamensis]|uniref:hypothetical protein n=1 Tax=Rossellomorea vietnamensis TaxID=218284 RepID=UPI003CEE8120
MSKKLIIILSISAALLGGYFINLTLRDDAQEIKKAIYSVNPHNTNIAHLEFLDNKQAIAFYEWDSQGRLHFGSAFLKKNLFGWELVGSSAGQLSGEYTIDWGFSSLESRFSGYTDLIRGKILDPQIEEVSVKTNAGNVYKANLIEYDKDEKFWFLVSKGENLEGSTITGLSSEGEKIEQITK